MSRVHYGPANGPDGLGQATACGLDASYRFQETNDWTKVTCRRCLKTREVRGIDGSATPAQQHHDSNQERT